MDHRKDSPDSKPPLKYFIIIIFSLVALTQLSGILVAGRGGVAGSFGIHVHDCIGLRIGAEKATELLPEGDFEFHFLLFHFRYSVSSKIVDSDRVYCLGQDIWFGE